MTCNVCSADVGSDRVSLVKDGFELLRCPRCGLLFRAVLPAPRDLAALYSAEYFADEAHRTGGYSDYIADGALHRSLARRRLQKLEATSDGRTLLDVGAAAGFFVAEAGARGWDARGIDISPAMVAYATETLGAPVAYGGLESVSEGAFDVVTMWDYIEHSLDPARDVSTAARLLNPGGLLALSTGDVSSLIARLSRARWHLLTPRHHNYFFSKRTIRLLLETRGFDVLHVAHPGARYSANHIVYKLEWMFTGRRGSRVFHRAAQSRLARANVPLNLFDIMTVIARRRTAVT
jgi:SAM-dependent methyltransferase